MATESTTTTTTTTTTTEPLLAGNRSNVVVPLGQDPRRFGGRNISRDAKQALGMLLVAVSIDAALVTAAFLRKESWNWHAGMEDAFAVAVARVVSVFAVIFVAVACCANPSVDWSDMELAEVEKLPVLDETQLDPKRKWERDAYDKQKRLESRRDTMVGVGFIFSTASALFCAAKIVAFDYEPLSNKDELLVASALGLSVVFSNVEFFLLRRLLVKLSKEVGRYVPSLHNRELFYRPRRAGHWCDVCHTRIVGSAYVDTAADFDVCSHCFDAAIAKEASSTKEEIAVRRKKNPTNVDYFKRALSFGSAQWPLFLASAIALIASSAASLTLPSFTGQILNDVFQGNEDGFKTNVMHMVEASAVITVLSIIQYACVLVAGRRIAASVRVRLFSSLVSQDISFFDAQQSGVLTSRMTNDVSGMVSPWSTIINTLLGSSLTLVGSLIMCLVTSWKLSALALASVGPIVFLTSLYAKWSRDINKTVYSALADANSVATEAFQNIRTVRAFSTEKIEVGKFKSAVDIALDKGVKDAVASAGTSAATSFVDLATSALILGFGGWQAIKHPEEMSAGDLLKFQLYYAMLDGSWRSLNGIVNTLTISAAAASRVLALLDSLPEIDVDGGAPVPDKLEAPPSIVLDKVSFRYPTRPESLVLDDVSITVNSGTVTALVGPSGGGKTTCVALMMGMYRPLAGRVLFNGQDLKDLQLRSVHKHVGLVSQDTQLFGSSVLSNITYAMPPNSVTREDVIEATKKANIFDEIMRWEHGFATKIGEKGVRLSGGQRQRIALARVFLRKPALLLLDEATSALDARNEALVQASIDSLLVDVSRGFASSSGGGAGGRGTTCVVVAHRLSTVYNADNICVVERGRLVEQGTHAELVERGGVYASLVKTQLVGAKSGKASSSSTEAEAEAEASGDDE